MSLPRNVVILGLAQALGLAAAPVVVLVAGVVGSDLAPRPMLTTLPVSMMVVGTALFAIPAARLMRRLGRRAGFLAGSVVAGGSALLAAAAVSAGSFWGLTAATLGVGASLAFVQQYRFAAAESVEADLTGRAVSVVLLGGVLGGVLGPQVANQARGWLGAEHAGSFLALAGLSVLAVVALLGYRNVAPSGVGVPALSSAAPASGAATRDGASISVGEILSRPGFLLAAAAGASSYAVMSFLMTATPLSMHVLDGHSMDVTSTVIQAHVVAMYTPSLFSGALIDRFGTGRMMVAGTAVMAASIATGASGHSALAYGVALVLLGVGWNLLFVSGTVLLTRSYGPHERFRFQALNDLIVFGTQATASLGAGAALHLLGWEGVNLVALLPLAVLLGLMVRATRALVQAPGQRST